jgi:hypothetical protein
MTERQKHQFLGNVEKESGVRVDTQTSDCWIWDGYKDDEGYGRLQTDWAKELQTPFVHRISYHLFCEPFLPAPRDKVIMHLCDTPACVNPDHLKLSTQLDNIKDRDVKGRQSRKRGAENNFSKFTMQDVEMIRTLRLQGNQIKDIAEEYKSARHTIADILNGKSYDMIDTESYIVNKSNMLRELINCWIIKLHAQKLSYRKIQEIVNRTPSYICKVLEKK